MMVACLDACCAMNLINGNALNVVSQLGGLSLAIQGLVEDEMQSEFSHIKCLALSGKVTLLSGDRILASEVAAIAEKYNLGLGEAECIAIGLKWNLSVASDDRKARRAASLELGASKVIGSIGLLKRCVDAKLVSARDAFTSYEEMKRRGAFLPRLMLSDFANH